MRVPEAALFSRHQAHLCTCSPYTRGTLPTSLSTVIKCFPADVPVRHAWQRDPVLVCACFDHFRDPGILKTLP